MFCSFNMFLWHFIAFLGFIFIKKAVSDAPRKLLQQISTFVDVVQSKDRNPSKYDRNKIEKDKIVEHSGAMTLTPKKYTHFDIKELVDSIKKI